MIPFSVQFLVHDINKAHDDPLPPDITFQVLLCYLSADKQILLLLAAILRFVLHVLRTACSNIAFDLSFFCPLPSVVSLSF